MTTAVLDRPRAETGAGRSNGGFPARRAMIRWAWRLFRREWRQQLLILALVVVAVAATVVGATVATTTRAPAGAGFGTASALADFPGTDPHLAGQIAALGRRFGPVDVIENETLPVPGSIDTYDLRAQDPHGPFGGPMLSVVSGRFPSSPGEVALTSGVASVFHLTVGDLWHQGGTARRVVGIVENPQSLLDEFALVVPGQVTAPTQVTVLFDAHGVSAGSIGPNVETPASVAQSNPLNPETIVLALTTIGMLLIALVSVGGFTVLAQRRLRSIGMVESLGATDRNVRLVVRANGIVVGVAGSLLGFALGVLVWLVYRPRAEAGAHHLIGAFALPWLVVVVAMVLAVVATFAAASRPAHSITKVPVVAALSGRPGPPKQVHRSAVPGAILLVAGFLLLGIAGSDKVMGALVIGLVALIVAIILLAPLCLAPVAKVTRRAPVSVRLALSDLARYRSRSGSALAAISLGVLIAVIICVAASSRYGNVLDWAGPNLDSNQLVVYTPDGNPGGQQGPGAPTTAGIPQSSVAAVHGIANDLGARDLVELDSTNAGLQRAAPGRNFTGPLYVATPQLLRAFGISPAAVDPSADILSMRPGLDSISEMQLTFGNPGGSKPVTPGQGGQGQGGQGQGSPSGASGSACDPRNGCLADPVIQEVSALPAGTSAPNTVITEHAVHRYDLQVSTNGWLIETAQPLTATQINGAQQTAAAAGMTVETKNDQPTSAEIVNWATVFGIVLALGILAMSVGLIRSETAGDLRILAATGASSSTRRSITAATAGALGVLGAVVGTVGGYLATAGFLRDNAQDGLGSLANVPVRNLLVILVGMPLAAAVGGWLLAGREPRAIARQPME